MVILIYDSIGDMKKDGMGVADIAANLTNIEQVVLSRTSDHFDLYGVGIDKISGLYISLPEEVQKAVDTRASMQVLGANYVQYQTGQAMREAAQNPSGGAAGAGVGVGAGIGMGWTMLDSMRQGQGPPGGAAPGAGGAVAVIACPKCGTPNPVTGKFCSECGAKLVVATKPCPKCGEPVQEGAKFCPSCGAEQVGTKKCPNCGAEVSASVKFCPECGKQV
jgi:membrane protease subunit (stomatin/prohibitin family)